MRVYMVEAAPEKASWPSPWSKGERREPKCRQTSLSRRRRGRVLARRKAAIRRMSSANDFAARPCWQSAWRIQNHPTVRDPVMKGIRSLLWCPDGTGHFHATQRDKEDNHVTFRAILFLKFFLTMNSTAEISWLYKFLANVSSYRPVTLTCVYISPTGATSITK